MSTLACRQCRESMPWSDGQARSCSPGAASRGISWSVCRVLTNMNSELRTPDKLVCVSARLLFFPCVVALSSKLQAPYASSSAWCVWRLCRRKPSTGNELEATWLARAYCGCMKSSARRSPSFHLSSLCAGCSTLMTAFLRPANTAFLRTCEHSFSTTLRIVCVVYS